MFFNFFKEKVITKESTIADLLSIKANKNKCDCCGEKKNDITPVPSSFGEFTFTFSCKDCRSNNELNLVSSDEFLIIFSQVEFNALLEPEKSISFYNINLLKRTNSFHFNCYDFFVKDVEKRNEMLTYMSKNNMLFQVLLSIETTISNPFSPRSKDFSTVDLVFLTRSL